MSTDVLPETQGPSEAHSRPQRQVAKHRGDPRDPSQRPPVAARSACDGCEGQDANSRVNTYGLLRNDYRRIIENIPNIRRAVPMRELRFGLRLGNRTADAKRVGCVADYRELNQLEMARGRWLTPRDRAKRVLVLADDTTKRLFPFENPIGQTIWVGAEFYKVIGQRGRRVLKARFVDELSYQQIGECVGMTLEAVRKTLFRIKKQVRSCVETCLGGAQ